MKGGGREFPHTVTSCAVVPEGWDIRVNARTYISQVDTLKLQRRLRKSHHIPGII